MTGRFIYQNMYKEHEIRKLQLRKAKNRDITDVLEIEKECSLSHWSWEDYQKEIARDNSLVVIAEIENKMCGFLVARFSTIEADILNIGVNPTYQKLGIGGNLLKYMLVKTCEMPIKSVWLEVRESNINAVGFYKKKGFEQIQIRKNFYSHPVEDAIVMKYDLKNSIMKL